MKHVFALALLLWGSALFAQSSEYAFFKQNHIESAQQVIDRYESGAYRSFQGDSLCRMHEWYIRALHTVGNYEQALQKHEGIFNQSETLTNEIAYSVLGLKALLLHQVDRRSEAKELYERLWNELPASFDSARASVSINYGWMLWQEGSDRRYYEITKLGLRAAQRAGDVRREQILWTHLAEYYEKVSFEFEQAIEAYERAQALGGAGQYREVELRLSLRRAVQLRDLKESHKESIQLLEQVQAEASLLHIAWLYEMATQELLRSNYVYKEYKTKRTIQFVAALALLLGVGVFLYRQRRLASDAEAYMQSFEDRLKSV